jgi:kynureninase
MTPTPTPTPDPLAPPAHEAFALALDQRDPFRPFRARFLIPRTQDINTGSAAPREECVYLTGNSLGLQPAAVKDALLTELDDWARLGVEGHTHARNPWLPYHEPLRAPLARLVGAHEHEVVAMNTLTANLHLLMLSFYRPTTERSRIIIEDAAFPSDSYAVDSQASLHGLNPADTVIRLRPREGESTLRTADIIDTIERAGPRLALVMLGGVNYLTGQFFDIPAITRAAHDAGALAGWDLAHAAGNVPLRLHDWNADFAVWCSYKYLNSGPGAVAGAYVHERHCTNAALPQLAGWWGNDPATRFRMQPGFVPAPRADRWALSNPPIFSLAPVRVSLSIFDEAGGLPALREKSLALTGYLEYLLRGSTSPNPAFTQPPTPPLPISGLSITTPADPAQRGCQLSLAIDPARVRDVLAALKHEGVVCDFREPDVIRAAPVPLYNSFHDVWRFARTLRRVLGTPES